MAFASTIFRLRKVPKPFIYGHSTTFTRICNKKMRIKHQSAAEQWFTALFMLKCGKDYDMKTNIRVVSCFDGDREAEDFFTDMIADRIRAEGKIIPFPKNEENVVESEQKTDYNKGVVGDHYHASGLCG